MRLVVLFLIIFSFGILRAENPDECYWKGYAADAANKYDEAIKHYKQAIEQKPDFFDAHYKLAIVYKEKGQFKEAIDHLKNVVALEPNHMDAHYTIGVCYEAQGLFSDAIGEYKNVIQIKDNHLDAHNRLAAIYYDMQMMKESIPVYRKIISLDSESHEPQYRLGSLFMKKGDYLLSIKHYTKGTVRYCKNLFKALLQYVKFGLGRYFDPGRWRRKLESIKEQRN